MSLFRLDASIFPANSASSEIADLVEEEWRVRHAGVPVTRRHVGTDPLPADAWTLATIAAHVPDADRSPEQHQARSLADQLAAELQRADAVILAVPLYNYGVSQHFKAWVDLVISGAGPTNPVLKGIPTVLATAIGGGYGPGTPREGWDHSTSYLERIIGDLWGADLTVVKRELTLAGTNPAMESLLPQAELEHARAREAARVAGRAIASSELSAAS